MKKIKEIIVAVAVAENDDKVTFTTDKKNSYTFFFRPENLITYSSEAVFKLLLFFGILDISKTKSLKPVKMKQFNFSSKDSLFSGRILNKIKTRSVLKFMDTRESIPLVLYATMRMLHIIKKKEEQFYFNWNSLKEKTVYFDAPYRFFHLSRSYINSTAFLKYADEYSAFKAWCETHPSDYNIRYKQYVEYEKDKLREDLEKIFKQHGFAEFLKYHRESQNGDFKRKETNSEAADFLKNFSRMRSDLYKTLYSGRRYRRRVSEKTIIAYLAKVCCALSVSIDKRSANEKILKRSKEKNFKI